MERTAVLALYRRGLAYARQLADPCCRHYAFGRLTAAFRRDRHEISPARVRQLLHDGRQSVRRLRGALEGDSADFQRLLALSYGRAGRVAHVLARAQAAVAQGRGHLAVLRAASPSSGPPQSSLVPTLLRRVPSLWAPRSSHAPAPAGAPAALPARHRRDFEATHVVLLHAVFLPDLPARTAAQPRARRRLYEAALGVSPPELRLAADPKAQIAAMELTFRGTARGMLAPAPPRDVAAPASEEAPRQSRRVQTRIHKPTMAQLAGLERAAAREAAMLAAAAGGGCAGMKSALAEPSVPVLVPLRRDGDPRRTPHSKTSEHM